VPHPAEPLEEAAELVERSILDATDFRDFVFTNPVSFYAAGNPDFFKGTIIEHQAADVRGPEPSRGDSDHRP
jgi:hypothetical protein